MNTGFKRLVRACLNRAGFDVIGLRNSPNRPRQTLLGLRARPIRTVIDVGANTGQFSREASGLLPDAGFYCFEPLPEPFAALSAWAETQKGRVKPFNLAIGDREGATEMFLHEDHTPSSSLLATTRLAERHYPFTQAQKRVYVMQTTLDAALAGMQDSLPPEILIKLDVQGYEDRVIAGGTGIFARAAACIVEINLDALYDGQAGFRQLLSTLEGMGFRYGGNLDQAYGDDGHCIFVDAVFLRRAAEK
jgi:FkbM family methyltransferase